MFVVLVNACQLAGAISEACLTYWTKAGSHRTQGLTRDTSQGLTEGRDSQTAAYERKRNLTEGRVSHVAESHRRLGLIDGKVTQCRVWQKGGSCILNKGRVSQRAGLHIRLDFAEDMVSRVSQNPGSQIWKKAGSHRRQGHTSDRWQSLTEEKVSEMARSHTWKKIKKARSHTWKKAMTNGRVAQKPGFHRRQSLPEGSVSRIIWRKGVTYWTKAWSHMWHKPGSHRRHGPTEGSIWKKTRSHRRQGLTYDRWQGLTGGWVSYIEQSQGLTSYRRQSLTECMVSQKAKFDRWQGLTGCRAWQMAGSCILNKGRASQKASPHRRQDFAEGRISQKQVLRHERKQAMSRILKVSHKARSQIWKKTASHRTQSLTEGRASYVTDRVSQKARPHILNKGKISQKARSHRRQDLTEGVVSHMKEDRVSGVSQKASSDRGQAGSHRRQSLTEGQVSQKAKSHR